MRASFAQIFVLSAPNEGLASMGPTFSPTGVAPEPTYAKLRQTETPELREAHDFFAKPSWAVLNAAFVYPTPSRATSNAAFV